MDKDTEKLLRYLVEKSDGLWTVLDLERYLNDIPYLKAKCIWLSGHGYLRRNDYKGMLAFSAEPKGERYFWPRKKRMAYYLTSNWYNLVILVFTGVPFFIALWQLIKSWKNL